MRLFSFQKYPFKVYGSIIIYSCFTYYGTPSLSYNAVYALYGMVISIYDVVTSIYCVVISICGTVVSLYGVILSIQGVCLSIYGAVTSIFCVIIINILRGQDDIWCDDINACRGKIDI